jgi:hypothetical protein
MHRLPCCHSNCPVTFKSQHGRTYHIRAVHTNFNSLTIDREHDPSQGHDEQDEASAYRLTNTGSADGWDTGTVPLDNNAVRGERIQHPNLTGERPIDFKSLNMQSSNNHN